MEQNINEITSVKDLLDIKDHFLYTSNIRPHRHIFRGIKKYDYPLTPGIGRLLADGYAKSEEELYRFEQSAFNEFRIATYNELRVTDDFVMMTTAQHHGLRTRLLDWSLSPLVALFFAVEDINCKKDGALISYQMSETLNVFGKAKSVFDFKNLEEYHFIFAPAISPRLKAQQSVFQYFKYPTKPFDHNPNLRKYRIPAKYKKSIKHDLHDLGITYYALFPDLEGLCKSINYEKLWAGATAKYKMYKQ